MKARARFRRGARVAARVTFGEVFPPPRNSVAFLLTARCEIVGADDRRKSANRPLTSFDVKGSNVTATVSHMTQPLDRIRTTPEMASEAETLPSKTAPLPHNPKGYVRLSE